MSNIDWSQLVTKQMKEEAIAKQEYEAAAAREDTWRVAELLLAADQLLAIDDDDPNRAPGTEREWRDYRIAVRAWKEGADHFPDIVYRPVQPK